MVSVDVAGREMLCKGAEALAVDMLIDHHGTNPGFAPQGHIDPSAAACGEVVYEILGAMGVSLDRPMAEALYVAVSTDTRLLPLLQHHGPHPAGGGHMSGGRGGELPHQQAPV